MAAPVPVILVSHACFIPLVSQGKAVLVNENVHGGTFSSEACETTNSRITVLVLDVHVTVSEIYIPRVVTVVGILR